VKIKRVEIDNFKGVKHFEHSFEGYGREPRFLTCLVGDNGSGKTTVLQAIALVLSLASRKTQDGSSLAWKGFLPERMSSLGPTRIALHLEQEEMDIRTVQALFDLWEESASLPSRMDLRASPLERPSSLKQFSLVYDGRKLTSPEGNPAINQLLGRHVLKEYAETAYVRHRANSDYPFPGDVFWFDQYRVLGTGLLSFGHPSGHTTAQPPPSPWGAWQPPQTWEQGVSSLREMLVGWWTYHKSERREGRDLIADLKPKLQAVFPGTKFVGVEPRRGVVSPGQKDFFFLLERDDLVYDISEMSSGEQAVFEILYEFVRLNIMRSVVLIDELELHLHPPQQQALLKSLRKLGPDCQFIITTHSPYIEEVLPKEEIRRMEVKAVVR
jgi:hypothetical protein